MMRSQRRLLLLLAALPLLILISALLYMGGMAILEQEPRTFWESLGFAAETLSTTGYGSDTRWSNPVMVAFVVILQFVGVFLVFLIFPIYLIPFLEERFESRLPKMAPAVDDHVVIYRYGPAVATLIDELEGAGVAAVIVEEDSTEARRQLEKGRTVFLSRLDDGALEKARLGTARALVANGSDDENAAVILAARQVGFSGDIVAVVEEPYHRKPMMLAGATAVYTPRHILGAALAARASERISPIVEGAQLLGRKLIVSEIRIREGSELAGLTLGETELGRRTGVSVLGQWVEGRLVANVQSDMELRVGGILVVAGSLESIERFGDLCAGAPFRRSGTFVLAGYGEVGRKVAELLRQVGERVQVIDREAGEGVDVVGDILDHRVLEGSELGDAQAAILAVDSDSATLFATVILKEFTPEVPVVARVNQAQNVERIHRAGADFALSVSQVAGQILATRLLGQEAITVDPRLKVMKLVSAGLVGGHPAELRIREQTGVSVVAAERGDELILEFDSDFRFRSDDIVYICGSDEATRRFISRFPPGKRQ
ncbi:MAG: NAD-binding protein [Acidobacteriota bacterium]|nr:NAD-binding protein [Acidobacteriota bacterium]